MKKRFFNMAGVLAVLLVFGLVLAVGGCEADDGGAADTSNPFAGTWRSPEDGGYYVLVFTEFTFTITSPTGYVESGNYTYSPFEKTATMKMTSGGSSTFNVSISGNTLSFGSRTYTKS